LAVSREVPHDDFHRRVLELTLEGKRGREIAELTGEAETRVRSARRRLLEQIREKLREALPALCEELG